MRGHLACDRPSTSTQSHKSGKGPTRGSSSKSGQSGPIIGHGHVQQVHFEGMNVLYDSEGYEYPGDDYRDKFMFPLRLNRLLTRRLRRKNKKTKKTEKILY